MKDVGYSATASYVCSSDDTFKSCSDLIFPLCVQETRFAGDFEGFWEDTDQRQTSGQSVRYPCVPVPCVPVSVPNLTPIPAHISFNIPCVAGSEVWAEVVCIVKLICSCVCIWTCVSVCVCIKRITLCAGMMASTLSGLPEGVPFLVSPPLNASTTNSISSVLMNCAHPTHTCTTHPHPIHTYTTHPHPTHTYARRVYLVR